jgi:hypothetical protein
MQRGGDPRTAQMVTFVNPQSGERVTLDMANEADVQMMDQLVSAGFVMDSPRFAEEEAGQRLQEMVPSMPMPYALSQNPRFARRS